MSPRTQRLVILLLACAGFGAGIAAAIWSLGGLPGVTAVSARQERPQVTGDFSLVDSAGRPQRWSELGNRLQLVFFGFTHCPEVCPVTLSTSAEAIRSLGDDGAGLRLLLISVDPERDTPERLREYTAPFAPQVLGLTGSAEQVAAAANAFHVMYEKMPPMGEGGDYMVNHTSSVFLMGPRDEILEIIPYGAKAPEIAAALRRHL
jgi:protein SCO1/2